MDARFSRHSRKSGVLLRIRARFAAQRFPLLRERCSGICGIFFAAFLAGCGGGVSVLPEPFTRERADGKIPVKVELIRAQVRRELDGTPEGESEVARWQTIETDYNQCRLSSAESSQAKAEEVFSVCMSERGYVYMLPIDAEQFHSDIAFDEEKVYAAEKKAAEEARLAAERKRAEEEERARQERLAIERARAAEAEKARQERLAAERQRAQKAAAARLAAEKRLDKKIFNWRGDRISWILYVIVARKLYREFWGDSEIVKVLLSAGANPDWKRGGDSTFVAAALYGHAEIVKILLSAGADPDIEDLGGQTALMKAARQGHAEVVKILLAAGANPNAETYDESILIEGFGSARMEKSVEGDGWTALASAVQELHFDIVEILLKAGANPNHVFDSGISVTDNAIYDNHPAMVKLLRRYGGVCRKNC